MADIVVTIPKGYFDENGQYAKTHFSIGRHPKRWNEDPVHPSTIFFVYEGAVRYWADLETLCDEDMTCEVTGKKWKGLNLNFSCFKEMKRPVPMTGFRSFRYLDRMPKSVQQKVMAGRE